MHMLVVYRCSGEVAGRGFSPQQVRLTGCSSLCSPAGGSVRDSITTEPWEAPTIRQGLSPPSDLLGRVSAKRRAERTSADSRSMLVTLELRERLDEPSLASGGE